MSHNLEVRIAGIICGVAILLDLTTLALIALAPVSPVSLGWGFRGFAILFSVPSVLFGILLVRRLPRHPITWFLCLIGLGSALQAFLTEYDMRALFIAPGTLGAGVFAAWVTNWIWVPLTLTVASMLFYFPTGELLSPRWRGAFMLAAAVGILYTATLMFGPGVMIASIGDLSNPYGIAGSGPLFGDLLVISELGWTAVLILSALSLLLRFRRSRGIERQQIKWVLYAATLVALVSPLAGSNNFWFQVPVIFGFAFVFIALGIAILRYRLYDIDIIIRRTLVYSVLTVILALIYFGAVVLLQQLFRLMTGAGGDIAIIISTLAIAALFNPLRHRVQDTIDHRFYRRKYDAQQVVARFGATVRDEVELDKLTDELLTVVGETMQPTQVALWLKK